MIWESIGNDRRGPTDLHLILLRGKKGIRTTRLSVPGHLVTENMRHFGTRY